jgi:hypothetical protein
MPRLALKQHRGQPADWINVPPLLLIRGGGCERTSAKAYANLIMLAGQDGEFSDYMLHTRLALRADGWIACDEWHWDKADGPPREHVERLRRSWESIHWFSLDGTPCIPAVATGTDHAMC